MVKRSAQKVLKSSERQCAELSDWVTLHSCGAISRAPNLKKFESIPLEDMTDRMLDYYLTALELEEAYIRRWKTKVKDELEARSPAYDYSDLWTWEINETKLTQSAENDG